MALKLYNTLTRKKEKFEPLEKGKVKIYTCGPTVWDYAHIGNFRAYVFEDLLRRYLKYKGYEVKQVMNLTDVDDKTIKGSQKEGIPLEEYTARYKKAFLEDMDRLNVERAEIYPEATKHIKQMVNMVKTLLDKGFAYKGKDGSIYYRISEFQGYGKLSGIDTKKLKSGARVNQQEYDKEQAGDFVLWKAWTEKDGDVYWETEIGKGRPGWHIECSAMSTEYLGPTFDLHAGGVDLIFPHHENEIAQSEAATGKKFVNYWTHNEHLIVEGEKMSKSLGNFYTLRDLKDYDPRAVRYVLMATHYRQQLDFTQDKLKEAETIIQKLDTLVRNLKSLEGKGKETDTSKLIKKVKTEFEKAMDDDLNISEALKHFFQFVSQVNKLLSEKKLGKEEAETILETLFDLDSVLGLGLSETEEVWHRPEEAKKEIEEKILEREKLRENKKFKKADEIRDELKKRGIILEDREGGTRWRKA